MSIKKEKAAVMWCHSGDYGEIQYGKLRSGKAWETVETGLNELGMPIDKALELETPLTGIKRHTHRINSTQKTKLV